MDLEDIRDKFIELSGRDDLANDDGTDNGADYFINAGQKFLDKRFGHAELSLELSNDSDTSWWTLEAPETLITAALYELELSYRNTEGARDWLGGIDNDLDGMEKDVISEEITGVDQMEG